MEGGGNMSTRVLERLSFNEIGVMEDDKQSLEAIRSALRGYGAKVTVAKNENEVVDLAKRLGIRNFILDVNMGTDSRSQEGLNALERLKAYDRRTYVSILTGFPQFRKQAERLSADHFQEKTNDRTADICHTVQAFLAYAEGEVKKAENELGPDEVGTLDLWGSPPDPLSDQNYVAYAGLRADPDWMSKHLDMYVAFVDGHQVGANRDEAALVADVRANYSTKPRFITHVVRQEEEIDIPSDLTIDDN
jgi:CheY-like chemotaxis protein